MRIQVFDQYEFDSPSSEQHLVLASSHKRFFPSLYDFAVATSDFSHVDLPEVPVLLSGIKLGSMHQLHSATQVTQHLAQFCGVSVAGTESALALTEEWDQQDYLLQLSHRFYRYYWTTTA